MVRPVNGDGAQDAYVEALNERLVKMMKIAVPMFLAIGGVFLFLHCSNGAFAHKVNHWFSNVGVKIGDGIYKTVTNKVVQAAALTMLFFGGLYFVAKHGQDHPKAMAVGVGLGVATAVALQS